MKIQVPLLNAVRFATDEHTRLHVHTKYVDGREPLLVVPRIGPKLHLRRDSADEAYTLTNGATPYGEGRTEITAFVNGLEGEQNWISTASSSSSTMPIEFREREYANGTPYSLNLTQSFRLSLFFRADLASTGGVDTLIAGIPGRLGLYQNDGGLWLYLHENTPDTEHWINLPYNLGDFEEAWHLIEVQWSMDRNDGKPMYWINGVPGVALSTVVTQLKESGDRFNIGHDPATPDAYWSGAIRELELTDEFTWIEDPEDSTSTVYTDTEFQARAMRLFGLSTPTSPRASYTRDDIAWIKVGGYLHKVSPNHPRATERGTLVEEERTNFWPDQAVEPATGPGTPVTLDNGRYTVWLEQKSNPDETPATVKIGPLPIPGNGDDQYYTVEEGDPVVIELAATSPPSDVYFAKEGALTSTITHLQIENGAGPTSHILTSGSTETRQVETLSYELTASDLDAEQGRLDLEITPQLDGPRAETGDTALAGDILSMSLTRDEIVSVDEGDDVATLPGEGLWQAWETRAFHVEWQPGARLLWEDTMRLVAAADYSGGWQDMTTPAFFYIGGSEGDPDVRANCFFRNLALDDWVPRYHADLHRFMYRQFGRGAFSEDEGSVFRRWRRVEGDGLALMARLGDRLKEQAFADTVDLMVEEWERELGFPSLWGLPVDERRAILANLFRALGATDAELEEQVSYVTQGDFAGHELDAGFAVLIERHKGDVGDDLKAMYEYYVQIPESFYKESYLALIRWLLDRVEPTQTVGFPVVRTEAVTVPDDKKYSKLDLGPVSAENDIPFEKLGSMTERDLVGLPGYPGLTPVGMWMPTNQEFTIEAGDNDFWTTVFPDVPFPSVLFPFIEDSSPLNDYVGGIDLLASGSPEYEIHDVGIIAGNKKPAASPPSCVEMNIRRGVELIVPADSFQHQTASPPDPPFILNLGPNTAAAFLYLFRVARLPSTGEANLFKCTDGTNVYYLQVDSNGDLIMRTNGTYWVDPDELPAVLPLSLGIRTGEWVCALAILETSSSDSQFDGTLKLFARGEEAILEQVKWVMDPEQQTTFSLGGSYGGSAASAAAQHAYLAAWREPTAADFDARLLKRFWTALNENYVLDYDILTGEAPEYSGDQASWPVGGSPNEPTTPVLAAKYNRCQFPYSGLGHHYDGEGMVRDVRGFGCNRQVLNYAPTTECIPSTGDWSITGGAGISDDRVISPEALTNATSLRWNTSGVGTVFATAEIDASETEFVTASCWLRTDVADPSDVTLFARKRSPTVPFDPIPSNTASHPVDEKWQMNSTVFAVPPGETGMIEVEFGLEWDAGVAGESIQVWGFQFTCEPVYLPYAPNHRTWSDPDDTVPAIAPASLLRFDERRFPGFQDRGFVSFRVKFEELLHLMPEDRKLILLDAYSYTGEGTFYNRAYCVLEWHDSDGEPLPHLRLKFRLEFWQEGEDPSGTEPWSDEVYYDMPPPEDSLHGWYDPSIERRIAVAWDLSRPVARTTRHIALWADNELADTYGEDEPDDPMDRSLLLRHLAIGASYLHFIDYPTATQVQPCAVFREVELLTRHHPGLFTPTRLQVREAEEAGLTAE